MAEPIAETQHNIEIHENLRKWQQKPVLQKVYQHFYQTIALFVTKDIEGKIVELGSGIGNMKMIIPEVICTDIFNNPWIDQVENAYNLSFENQDVSNIILFDVWHHLKYPGTALAEFKRVLKPGGRIIIFEPAMSLLGFIVYGLFHHEPIGFNKKISWVHNEQSDLTKNEYYAAQGNASRIFDSSKFKNQICNWKVMKIIKMSAISYVLSGGYSKRQLFPMKLLQPIRAIEKYLDYFPLIFATRLMVVLEKRNEECNQESSPAT